MPSGQSICTNALTIIGITTQGGTPSPSDSNSALNELNSMWDAWGIDEGLIFEAQPLVGQLSAGIATYTMGPGGSLSGIRPSRIYKATILAAVGGAFTRRPIRIVPADEYFAHGDLAAAAASPDEAYPDYNVDINGAATLYLFPAPTCPTQTKIELLCGVVFGAWSLGGTYLIPQGYQDAIQYALAWRLIPQFGGIISADVRDTVEKLAEKAEVRIRTMNSKNRQLERAEAALTPLEQPEQPPQR